MFYSSEAQLESNQEAINVFYTSHLTKSYLDTPAGKLFYAYAIPDNAATAVVISTGRVEGLEKYKELIWELYCNNFAVFIMDHQGQGRSYRHLKNKHKGFVKHYNNYSSDLNNFDQQIVSKHWQGKKIMLAHSMGSAIAIDYLAKFENSYKGVFLSAPMFDIFTKDVPKIPTQFIVKLATLLGLHSFYAFGQGNYNPIPFAENVLTSSEERYTYFRQTYKLEPNIQLGGVTFGWLAATIAFLKSIDNLNVSIPLFIASAASDTVVNNKAQYSFAKRHAHATIESFEDAKHELLFERDEIRKPLLTNFYQFCKSVTS
ncbi:alpha/beta fold hydrolase [Pseudoalteromonas sp. MMG006]|uniref:alpha/beta fold hydrolase n=1 Tax=Pseudoalteromonas sp. MMG006 TaxID=2822683 RepID=UPI001B3885DB|nr:alpha/beta fold hydrolase [Pseudoalteromonas sp. MMG006]MBQ4798517.1 alpha/beta fold hydrolase [Pseudoalteromonas sp. MMG006]